LCAVGDELLPEERDLELADLGLRLVGEPVVDPRIVHQLGVFAFVRSACTRYVRLLVNA